jgi:hypothetical protein
MFGKSRASMIARLALLGAAALTMGAQSSCSSGDEGAQLIVEEPGGDTGTGTGTSTGPTFQTTLSLKNSSGMVTSQFRSGELITFELTVLNRTNAPITVPFPAMGGYADFQVFDHGTDSARFDWLANKLFPAVVTELTFEAHGSHTFTGTWDWVDTGGTMVPAGQYDALGLWISIRDVGPPLTDADTHSPRVPFRVN